VWGVDALMELFGFQKSCNASVISPDVEHVVGRKPISFTQFATVDCSNSATLYSECKICSHVCFVPKVIVYFLTTSTLLLWTNKRIFFDQWEPRKGLSRSSGIKGNCTVNRIKLNYRQHNKPALWRLLSDVYFLYYWHWW